MDTKNIWDILKRHDHALRKRSEGCSQGLPAGSVS